MDKILANEQAIPEIGLGVYKMTDEQEAYDAMMHALKIGYRHIDTAAYYFN